MVHNISSTERNCVIKVKIAIYPYNNVFCLLHANFVRSTALFWPPYEAGQQSKCCMDEFDSMYVSDLNYFLNETGIFNDIWKHHCYTRMFFWKHVMLSNSRGRDHMVLRFTIIKCLSALTLCVVSLNHAHGDVQNAIV
jgi:hypothetical protein